jgi:hypothetical protein
MDRYLGRDQDNLSEGSQEEVKPGSAKKRHSLFIRQYQKDSDQAGGGRQGAQRQVDNVNQPLDIKKENDENEDILEKARKMPKENIKGILDIIIEYHRENDQSKISDDEYINSCKKSLEVCSSREIWEAHIREPYEKVNECVVNKKWSYAKSKSEDGKCTLHLPSKTDYPMGIPLRCVDEALCMKYDKLLVSHQQFDADFEARVDITATALEMNMKMDNRGWKMTKEYPLANRYEKYLKDSICYALKEGLIDKAKAESGLMQVVYKYAREKLHKYIRELRERNRSNGVPDIFLNVQPGSYFREWDQFKKMKKEVQLKEPLQFSQYELDEKGPIKISEDNRTLSMTGPVKLVQFQRRH